MHRIQILLEDSQHEALRTRAEREGCRLSDLVRRILTEHLGVPASWVARRLDEVAGMAEGPADLGENHDSYLFRVGGGVPPFRAEKRSS